MNVPSKSAARNTGKSAASAPAGGGGAAAAAQAKPARKAAPRASAGSAAAERLHEVEVKLSFVDDLVDSLNRTVYRQQQQIDQLAQALQSLRRQVQSGVTATGGDAREDRPPHY